MKTALWVGVILLITGVIFYPKLKTLWATEDRPGGAAAAPKPGGGGPAAVNVLVVQTGRVDDVVKATGTIMPNEEVELHSEVSGRITGLYIREGQLVGKGQVLLKTFDDDLQAQIRKLEYQKKLAQENESRQKRLLDKEAISQQEYDISLTGVNTIQAEIENVRAQLSRTVVRAPFSGKIGLRYVSPGAYITPATRIATLTNSNPAKLDFAIPAKYSNSIRRGSRVNFTVENTERSFQAIVTAVDPKIDPQTRTLQIRAQAPNASGQLIPGLFARVDLILSSKGQAISIPTEAILPQINGQAVYLIRGGKAVLQPVTLGTRGDREIEILTGVSAGDSLVVSGTQQVRPGGPVKVQLSAQPDSLR